MKKDVIFSLLILTTTTIFAQSDVKAQQRYEANYHCEGNLPGGSAKIIGTRVSVHYPTVDKTSELFQGEMRQNGRTFEVYTSGNKGHIGGSPVSILFPSQSTMEIWTDYGKPGRVPDKLGTLYCETN